jgi:hypothetical protein
MIDLIGYVGAGLMVGSTFKINTTGGKLVAMAGLTLLTIQAIDLQAWNLIILNTLSTGGYWFAIKKGK